MRTFTKHGELMKRLNYGQELQDVMSNRISVFVLIRHKMSRTVDLHKGILNGAGGGDKGRHVCFVRDSDKEEWDLPIESCFIDDENPGSANKFKTMSYRIQELEIGVMSAARILNERIKPPPPGEKEE